ncbi:MAG: phosphoenolpyruvate--protein phosphotransferase [Chlamydiae bacterium CG10_big_fil_rev_8_21_14_0_10_35_9]|nr:MAG: phosphoenolpyruvate--protein phosphotransferase [Chlamydiae bacterium CG10_big_fil_rev_8_21_14_0_10_35_9]
MNSSANEIVLQGLTLSEGIAIGLPFFFPTVEDQVPKFAIAEEDLEKELDRYKKAIYKSEKDLRKLCLNLEKEDANEVIEILKAHLEILKDPLLNSNMERKLYEERRNIESIFQDTIYEFKERFLGLSDSFFQDRVKDIVDVSKRILRHLSLSKDSKFFQVPFGSVVFSKELMPSDIAEVNNNQVSAFVTQRGGLTSHTAIIARAKGIPFIANIDTQLIGKTEINSIIVDGFKGVVILNPNLTTLKKYQKTIKGKQGLFDKLQEIAHLKTETLDKETVNLFGNIETQSDIDLLLKYNASGVGLFRSEYLFLMGREFPTEEDQFNVYRSFVKKLGKLPLVIRIFDIGGDKNNEYILKQNKDLANEMNPVLGCRAIRYLMSNEAILISQLRAILRASIYGNIHILVPMVSDVSELLFVREKIQQVRGELEKENILLPKKIPLGCMIEVPSSAIMSEVIAQEADFLSIGTNDLIQYVMAADRTNPHLSHIYTASHPSIIRLIQMVVEAAINNHKPLLLCGEIAADAKFIPILLGLGIRDLSVSSRHLPLVKDAIRKINLQEAIELTKKALKLTKKEELQEFIQKNYQERLAAKN